MDAQLIDADDRLARVFSHVYAVRQSADAPAVPQQLLPNYELLLVFNFGPELPVKLGESAYEVQRVAVIGPLQKLLRYELRAGASLLVVVFTLNGFYRLFGKLLRQPGLAAADVELEPALLTDLWSQLSRLGTTEERVWCFSAYALANLAPEDPAMQPLLDTIPHFRDPLLDPLKAVAQRHTLSTRTLQLRFQRQLGYSAKEMIRFIRFKGVIAQLLDQQPAPPAWATLVVAHGYYDQSHLNRDFQHFTGLSPGVFVEQLTNQNLCISQPGKFY